MRARLFTIASIVLLTAGSTTAEKFYPDDPLQEVPPLWPTNDPQTRALSAILETFNHTFGIPGEAHPERGVIPARGVNTLGEVMDGPWFVNRHGRERFSRDGLLRGPGDDRAPADGAWQVLTVKRFGFRPGILIADSTGQIYLLRFDPPGWLEMATGAEVVTSKFFHAIGYHVPEPYLVYFQRDRLVLAEGGTRVTSYGDTKDLSELDIDVFLDDVARDPTRGYRATAIRVPSSWEGLIGPYQVFGTRSDDPNDIVPHEHRRDLRGLFVFASWLNHTRMGAVYTLDSLMIRDDTPFIRHHLVDFYATLGSGGTEPKKSFRGREKTIDIGQTFKNIATMGVYTPAWMRARYDKFPAVGHFDYETFDPERWVGNTMIAPFANRLPDDTFWAAKIVMSFTDDDIRTLVNAGEYSDPEAAAWIAKCLIERRDRIGATYYAKVLPLDDFETRDGELHFRDLAFESGLAGQRDYTLQWSQFDNQNETHTPIGTASSSRELPPIAVTAAEGTYVAGRIFAAEAGKTVTVYLRKRADSYDVVGLERDWPGKVVADSSLDVDAGTSRFNDLDDTQKHIFEGYTETYNEQTGFALTPEAHFNSMTISERTTFDAVTHALMNSELTDASGEPLGHAIDLVTGIERIAGQYYGRSGDQQFRIYVFLRDDARELLEASQEFALGHLNTVYHAGYPYSFRQAGTLPNIQFSVSEGGDRADIDVDYRSSKMPQAMFNGHLTSANSDVRAGDNHDKHVGRWGGFVAWWRNVFGDIADQEEKDAGPGLFAQEPREAPTPLPPDRPAGSEPDELEDAAQEFLTDWLVRRKVKESLMFMSRRALACVDTDDDIDQEVLRNEGARAALEATMELGLEEMGPMANLTEAIDVILPWRESIRVVEHPFESDFALLELTDADASVYLCGDVPETSTPDDYGTYYATLFRFKLRGSAVLGILWAREEGKWRIVAWEAFQS